MQSTRKGSERVVTANHFLYLRYVLLWQFIGCNGLVPFLTNCSHKYIMSKEFWDPFERELHPILQAPGTLSISRELSRKSGGWRLGSPTLKPKNSLIGAWLKWKACRGHRLRTSRQTSARSQGPKQSTVFTIFTSLLPTQPSYVPCLGPCELKKRRKFPSLPRMTE